jgi:hypothetical protein
MILAMINGQSPPQHFLAEARTEPTQAIDAPVMSKKSDFAPNATLKHTP